MTAAKSLSSLDVEPTYVTAAAAYVTHRIVRLARCAHPSCQMTGTAIPVGATSAARSTSGRLEAQTVAVRTLDADTRARAFALFQHAYEGADRSRFERDLAEKQLVILLRDRSSRELKGFSTVLLREVRTRRGPGTVVFSGDTVIDRAYWGQKNLQLAFAKLLITLKLRSPHRRLYWFLISKGWRTYLLLANAFVRAVPRFDTEDDRELRRMLDAHASARFGPQYDAERGIIRYATPHERVRTGLAPVAPDLLDNPHVRFFVERNPGHADGDELACLAEVRAIDLMKLGARFSARALRKQTLWPNAAARSFR